MTYDDFEDLVRRKLSEASDTLTEDERNEAVEGHWSLIDRQYSKARVAFGEGENSDQFDYYAGVAASMLVALAE